MLSANIRSALAAVGGCLVGGGASYLYLAQKPQGKPSARQGVAVGGVAPPTALAVPGSFGARPLSPRHQELLKYGLPIPMQLQTKQNYVSLVDYRLKEPVWVIEHLTRANLEGSADRGNVQFRGDDDVPPAFRATNEDYFKSGYSRGHMAPASNNKSSIEAMRESFLLSSNIVPQELDNNMFYWHRMEMWVKDLVQQKGFDQVYVMSGPLFLPTTLSSSSSSSSSSASASSGPVIDTTGKVVSTAPIDTPGGQALVPLAAPGIYSPPPASPSSRRSTMTPGKPFTYMQYRLIGDSKVAVPTHLFKAVLAEKYTAPNKPPQLFFASFVVPNTPIAGHLPLRAFQVPREVLERYAGFTVFDRAFAAAPVTDLCSVNDPSPSRKKNAGRDGNTICALVTPQAHQYFTLERDLANARTLEDAQQAMQAIRKLEASGEITVEKRTVTTYERKVQQLSGKSKL
ncbi:hypothetical protein RI367_008136 [Sorochytrium milnesiophthora]